MVNFFGEFVVEAKYDALSLYSDDPGTVSLARFKQHKKYGFIDTAGQEIIPADYDSASVFEKGYALVYRKKEKFVINTKGEVVSTNLYKPSIKNAEADPAPYSLIPVPKAKWKAEFFQEGMEEVFSVDFGDESQRKWDLTDKIFRKGKKWGLVSYGEIIPAEYDTIIVKGGKNYIIEKNGLKGFKIDRADLVAPIYNEVRIIQRAGYSNSYLFLYRKGNLWGYRNHKHVLSEPKFKSIQPCAERGFLYEVILPTGKAGYIEIDDGDEYFTEIKPLTIEEMSIFFIEAEAFANSYLEANTKTNWEELMQMVEKCVSTALLKKKIRRSEILSDFVLRQNISLSALDTSLVLSAAKRMKRDGIIEQKASNVSPKLVSACAYLREKFKDLISEYPRYPFSQIVSSFSSNTVNELNPSIIEYGMNKVLKDVDFNSPFYEKVALLYSFNFLAYWHLVDQKIIPHPFKN